MIRKFTINGVDAIGRIFAKNQLPAQAAVCFVALALLPFVGFSNYVLHLAVLVFVYVALSLGLNIVVGLAGMLDLGYVAFYAVGAYTYAILSIRYHPPFLVVLIVSAVLAGVVGVVLGWPTIRARGDYLALVTLGFGEIIRLLMRNWNSLTNGPRGLMDVPPPHLGKLLATTSLEYYYLGLCVAGAAVVLFWRVKRSLIGQQLVALRDDEDAAAAIGINPVRRKLYGFAVGALMAGVCGAFFASWQRFVSPESFTLNESILILSMVVLGGVGRLWSVVGAAAFLVLMPEFLRGFESQRGLVLGILLVLAAVTQERSRLRVLSKQQQREPSPGLGPPPQKPIVAFSSSLPVVVDDQTFPDDDHTILHISKLGKVFGGVRALAHVSLAIKRGEVIGLVGANGAGKTTLFNCLTGALRPDTGEIYLCNGRRQLISGLPTYDIARLGIVRTFQHARLFDSMTAVENVRLGLACGQTVSTRALFAGRRAEYEQLEAAEVLLAIHGVASPKMQASVLSSVEQKVTELARSLATQPQVMLIDEPAAGMDQDSRLRLASLLREINRSRQITLVIIEHDLGFLRSLCHRLVVMDRGEIRAAGLPDDAEVRQAIRQTYFHDYDPQATS
jgi:branched-chain amino acid transport system permease protein